MEREKLLGELAHLNVVPAQPGEVFHEHRRDVPGLDCGNHFLKARALHGSSGDTVIHEKDGIRITLVLVGLLKYFLLRVDLSSVNSAKCSKLINCYLSLFINNKGLPIDTAAPSACRETRFIVQSWTGFLAYNSQIRIM